MEQFETLFHKCERPALEPAALVRLSRLVMDEMKQQVLGIGQIQIYSPRKLTQPGTPDRALLDEILKHIPIHENYKPDFLVCEWAPVHEDSGFSGQAFVSLVLHTGPHPYYLQSVRVSEPLYTEDSPEHPIFRVTDSTLLLGQGDLFVFDPVVPHVVMPTRPADGQLLILLQWPLPYAADYDKRAVRAQFPSQSREMQAQDTQFLRD